MERWARARFRVIRVNRWSLALLLLILLTILLWPMSGPVPALEGASLRSSSAQVKQGVTVLTRDFSGKTEAEARAMLQEMAALLQAEPIAAEHRVGADGLAYVIPELNGYSLDVDNTWFRLAVAPEGALVTPATRVHTPSKRMSDYPDAVIRQGNPEKRAVVLLINVDWGERELARMLPVLKKHGVKTTFFVSGRWASKNRALVKRMAEDGHEIASHGHNLSQGPFALARAGKLESDITRSVAVIEEITGNPVQYWAPHMSEVNPEIVRTAAKLKLRTVLYSLDTVDWHHSATEESLMQKLRQAKPGDLILMHPKPVTARVLEQAILDLKGRGLKPVTLSEMLSPDPDTPPGVWQRQHE